MALFGLLNLNKPSGVTSRRVVDQVQRFVRPDKVGHAGTLDPLASGVLVLGIGQATRLVEYVQQMTKRYRATFLLGRTSNTEDVEGEVTLLVGAPEPAAADLERVIAQFTGDIQQRPPAFSALKISGQRAYTLARAGQNVELSPRSIHIYRLQIYRYEYPELCLDVECSSGTYIRSLGRDLAERAGTGAVMSALVRQAVGQLAIEQALDPETLSRETIAKCLLDPKLAVDGVMGQRVVTDEETRRLAHGLSIGSTGSADSPCAAVDQRGTLVAILIRRADGSLGPTKFFLGST